MTDEDRDGYVMRLKNILHMCDNGMHTSMDAHKLANIQHTAHLLLSGLEKLESAGDGLVTSQRVKRLEDTIVEHFKRLFR